MQRRTRGELRELGVSPDRPAIRHRIESLQISYSESRSALLKGVIEVAVVASLPGLNSSRVVHDKRHPQVGAHGIEVVPDAAAIVHEFNTKSMAVSTKPPTPKAWTSPVKQALLGTHEG